MKDLEIHASAFVDAGASVGVNTKIWHFSHVCSGASIGSNVTVGQNVFVGGGASIGNHCKIQNNVSIYDGVSLEEAVFCGPSVVFTNVNNPRATVSRKEEYRPTVIGRGASLGANSTILCGVTIGKYAFVGAGAVVTKDVIDYSIVTGVPAVQSGWVSEAGEILNLPLRGEGRSKCPRSGEQYKLVGDRLIVE